MKGTHMNATATKPVRQRSKPIRLARLVVSLGPDGKNGLLKLTVGKLSTDYLVNRIPSDFGTAYRLDKAGAADSYDVLIDDDSGHSCTCPGHSSHGRCKHVSGLLALKAAGRL
jgi:hypothetical protein